MEDQTNIEMSVSTLKELSNNRFENGYEFLKSINMDFSFPVPRHVAEKIMISYEKDYPVHIYSNEEMAASYIPSISVVLYYYFDEDAGDWTNNVNGNDVQKTLRLFDVFKTIKPLININ